MNKKSYNSLFHLPTLVRPKDLISVSPDKHLNVRARNRSKESEKRFRKSSKIILDSSVDIQSNPLNLLTSNNLRKRPEKIKKENRDVSCSNHIYRKPENQVNIVFTIKRNNKLNYISQ